MGQAKVKKKKDGAHKVNIQGLREGPYMITDELIQWMKLGVLSSELEVTYKATQNKEWRKYMKMASTLCTKVLMARIMLVDPKQANNLQRRREHNEIRLFTSDELRLPENCNKQEQVVVALEDLYDVADLALNSCLACPQGECVENCFYRKVFHRLSFPVTRENPCKGECEFVAHAIGEVANVRPQNQRMNNYFEDDNKI